MTFTKLTHLNESIHNIPEHSRTQFAAPLDTTTNLLQLIHQKSLINDLIHSSTIELIHSMANPIHEPNLMLLLVWH